MAGLVPAISLAMSGGGTAVSAGRRSRGFAHATAREPRSSLGLAISARGRRLDDDRLAGIDDGGVAARKLLHATVVAPHGVLADLTGFAPGQAERTHATVARQNRAIHLLQETNGAAHAVAGIPAAASARTWADVEILEQHWIAKFQHLGVGQSRVGHVGVHGVGAGKTRARRRPRAYRLVVLVLGVAEIEVVHAALRGGERAERAEQAI